MFKENWLDKTLREIKKLIPKSVFEFFQPIYHTLLAYGGAFIYGFPSRGMKVIGVTGTKGKSTTVMLLIKIFEGMGHPVGAISSLGFKIKDKTWPNDLKMTMPGRFKIHKFMAEAKRAGCKFFILEVTSEGIKQKRHLGITFDGAVFTNIHPEHIETHGSFENYLKAKTELFQVAKNVHVINCDDPNFEKFVGLGGKKSIFYGIKRGDLRADKVEVSPDHVDFEVYGSKFHIDLGGEFNVYNALAAMATGAMYGGDLPTFASIFSEVSFIPGRMEFIQKEPFKVVIDYAHTPDSLKAVYKTLKNGTSGNLICVLGAAGGGRDKWKRPEFGRLASNYCDEVILTDEDPYDENPNAILDQIELGFSKEQGSKPNIQRILDRKEAIKKAVSIAKDGDTVIITGKGSEVSMALAGGKKIPWSEREVVKEVLGI